MSKEYAEQEQDDHIRLYLREIGQYKLLTKEEEVMLSQKIERGTLARQVLGRLNVLESKLAKLQDAAALNTSVAKKETNSATKREQAKTLQSVKEDLVEQKKTIGKLRNEQYFKRLGADNSSAQSSAGKNGSIKPLKPKDTKAKSDSAGAQSGRDITPLVKELESLCKNTPFLKRLSRECELAETQFINSNLRLVVSIAKKYQASKLPLLDLIQEGNLGLIHAVTKFEWQKGFKFSTYATWWIRQAITRGIANTSRTIRLPVHAVDIIARLQKARSNIETAHGRPASLEEIAMELNMEESKVSEALQFAGDPISLSDPLRESGDAQIGDIVEDTSVEAPDVAASRAMMPKETEKMLSTLNEREQEILTMRFGIITGQPKTLEEVGEAMSLTRERVRQLEARAMSKLRHPSSDLTTRDIFPF